MVHSLAQGVAFLVAVLVAATVQANVVRIGDLGITADAPFYIALEKGWFRDAGIDVRLEKFATLAEAMAPLGTGDLQVLGGGVGASLFNAFARGWPVRVVMGRTRDLPKFSSNALSVRADLAGHVKRIADLKGRKIAINAPAAVLLYMAGKMLEADGLAIKDVELVTMPWPNMGPAFERKAIDAGTLVEPFITQYAERGTASLFRRAGDVLTAPPLDASVILYNHDWATKAPELAQAFSVVYLRAARFFLAGLNGGPERAEVIDTLVKNTRLKERALYDRMQISTLDPNGMVSRASLADQQAWHAKNGSVPKPVAIDDIVDERWLRHALAKLGTAM